MIAHGARYADPAGFGESLQSGSNIHPVAVDVAVLDDDVAEIDAHTEYDPLFLANAVIAIRHPALDRDGTGDSLNDARELDQQTIARRLYDPALVLADLRVDEFTTMGSEPRKCAGFVLTHEAAVTGDIGGENGRKTPLYSLSAQCSYPISEGIAEFAPRSDATQRSRIDTRASFTSAAPSWPRLAGRCTPPGLRLGLLTEAGASPPMLIAATTVPGKHDTGWRRDQEYSAI